MDILLSPQTWLVAGLIFLLRVVNMSISTLRILLTMRGQRGITWFLSVMEAGIFVIALTYVVNDLTNWLNIVAYSTGFATGNSVGAWLETRIAMGHTHLRIISSHKGQEIAAALREKGYGVTEIPAYGRDGEVTLLNASVLRKNVTKVRSIVEEIDRDAFMTSEDLHPIRRGYWGR
jgi:uncharacterized protein YebE (UPF0316 family)